MFAGFAPLLLQWPFLSVMYLLFRSPQVGGTANTLLTRDLFGVPLGMHWLSGAGAVSAQGAVFLGVFALLAGLCWLSARLGRLMTAQAAPARPGRRCPGDRGRPRAAGPGAAVPDRGLRRVRPAGGGYLPAHVAGLVPGRAGVLLAAGRAWERLGRSQHRPRCSAAGGSLRSGPADTVSPTAPGRRVGEITDLHT